MAGQWLRQMLHSEVNEYAVFSKQTRNMKPSSRPLSGYLRMQWLTSRRLRASLNAVGGLDGRAGVKEQHQRESSTLRTRRAAFFWRCPSVHSQSPSAWELLSLFTNALVTSVEAIRLLNPEPAIGCASAAIIGRFVAITHRKQSLADLMSVFGCRGWRDG